MSRFLPSELRVLILNYLPLEYINKLDIPLNVVTSILDYKYNINPAVTDTLIKYHSILDSRLLLFKIATLMGESATEQEIFHRVDYCLIRAIINNNFTEVKYYLDRIYRDMMTSRLIDLCISLALERKYMNMFYLFAAFCLSDATGVSPNKIVDQIKQYQLGDSEYPVYSFDNPKPPISKYDYTAALDDALCHFDFPGIRQNLADIRKYQLNQIKMSKIIDLRAILLPIQLFKDLSEFRTLIKESFAPDANVTLYLTLLDILADKPIELIKPWSQTELLLICKLACSVLHQQTAKLIELEPSPGYLLPSEKLYHFDLLSVVIYNFNIYSVYINNCELQYYGMDSNTPIEFGYFELTNRDSCRTSDVAQVKILRKILEPYQTIYISPNNYREYVDMQQFMADNILFSAVDYKELEQDRDQKQRMIEIYTALTT